MFHYLLMGSRLLIFAQNCELGVVVFVPAEFLKEGQSVKSHSLLEACLSDELLLKPSVPM
jgi:hypothetical protein